MKRAQEVCRYAIFKSKKVCFAYLAKVSKYAGIGMGVANSCILSVCIAMLAPVFGGMQVCRYADKGVCMKIVREVCIPYSRKVCKCVVVEMR